MPIIRYFVFVGGVLLALLFATDRYLPAPVDRPDASGLDKIIIRTHSAQSLPEHIVFDTSARVDAPTVAAAQDITPEANQDLGRQALAQITKAASAK